ncbi:Bacterial type II/III secretion system short domain protein [Planctomycetes bacterium MalM25]|nr:Bacterial type II/III secretion system short domain protein [Planctomycetes bacterium MalM25]
MPRPLRHLLLIAALMLGPAPVVHAAESEMVGLLAVAIEPEVATQLVLSEEQLAQLTDLADQRELKGFSRAMKLSKLPREERIAQFADFRAESEKLAMAILTEEQAAKLREIAAESEDPALKPSEEAAESAENTEEAKEEPAESKPAPKAESPSARAVTPTEPVGDVSSPETAPVVSGSRNSPGKLSFNFQQQPWGDVLRWFSEKADLSLVIDTAPPGTLNYRDDRLYTPAEALDVLNGVLLTKGYTLVRKERMLLVIDLEQDVIPPNMVTDVPVDRLDQRGEYEIVRVLIELGDADPASAADSLLRLAGPQGAVVVLPEARMLQVTETAGRIRTMLAVIEAMRRAAQPTDAEEAELRSYPTGGADPATTLAVLQTLLDGSPTARLATDEATGSLIALATPAEHRAIEQALGKLTTDGRRVELIPVVEVDPLVAATLVTRLFDPAGEGDDKKRDPNAPVVEADPYTDSLLVRGTSAQVEQIRQLVSQLDTPDPALAPGAGGTIRTLPVTDAELRQALEQIETLWPTLRGNPLRMATPGGEIPSFRPGADVERQQQRGEDPLDLLYEDELPPPGRTTEATRRSPFRFANQTEESEGDGPDPIYITPGAGTTVIASRDVEALDDLENLLATVLQTSTGGGRQYAVFYLKFADASTAAALLNSIFGGDSGGGGGLMGDLAGAAVGGGAGGDLLGDLLGMGGGAESVGFDSVSVDVVPDLRLNALYVYASPTDQLVVNKLLRVIDQPRGPDRIESTGVARLIRVENTSASDIAAVVSEVFKDRLDGGSGGGQPSPQDFLRAMQGGGNTAEDQEPEKMTLGIDERSNSLVVRSSEPLFEQVKALVEDLDRAGVERPVSTRVVSLRNTSSNALRETLVSLLGEKAEIGAATGEAASQNPAAGGGASKPGEDKKQEAARNAERQQREMQQGMERLQQFRRMLERGRGQGGPGGGRGGRGGGPRGGGGPGGGRGR